MKKLSMAAALALVVAGPALAGAKGAVVMEPVVEDPYAGAAPSSLPAGTTALVAAGVGVAVVAGGSDSPPVTTTTGTP
jgi:hypothetical protein